MPMAMKMWKAMKMATAMTVSGCCWLDRLMGLVAIVLLAKRLIDIIRVVDNSLLAGLGHSLARWRGLQRCVWKSLTLFEPLIGHKTSLPGAATGADQMILSWKQCQLSTILETMLVFCNFALSCHQMLALERRSILSVIEGLQLLCPPLPKIYEARCTLKQTPRRLGFKIGLSSGRWINWSERSQIKFIQHKWIVILQSERVWTQASVVNCTEVKSGL